MWSTIISDMTLLSAPGGPISGPTREEKKKTPHSAHPLH